MQYFVVWEYPYYYLGTGWNGLGESPGCVVDCVWKPPGDGGFVFKTPGSPEVELETGLLIHTSQIRMNDPISNIWNSQMNEESVPLYLAYRIDDLWVAFR